MAKQTNGKPGKQTPPNNDDDGNDDDDGETISDALQTRITNLVNAAVSGQLSRKLQPAIKGALDESIAPLREQLEKMGTRRGGNDDEDDGEQGGQGKAKGGQARKDPEVENMRKQLAQLTEERKTEREQARNRERDGLLREQLAAAGVEPNRLRGAAAVLRDSLKYDDKAGEWTYKAKRDGYDEDLDLAAGVSEWASTDEGKSYLAPPSNAAPRGGSGSRPAGNGGAPKLMNGGRPAQDPKAAKAQAKADAVAKLSGAIDQLSGGAIPLG